jgi:hypothetical protein
LGTRTTFAIGGFIVVLSGVASAWVFGDIKLKREVILKTEDEVQGDIEAIDLQPQTGGSV